MVLPLGDRIQKAGPEGRASKLPSQGRKTVGMEGL